MSQIASSTMTVVASEVHIVPPSGALGSGRLCEKPVIELAFVEHDVRVRGRGDGEVALADVLADARPGHAPQVKQRDRPVA